MANWKNIIKDFLYDNSQKLADRVARIDEDALAVLILKRFFQHSQTNVLQKQLAVVLPALADSEKLFESLKLWIKFLGLEEQIYPLFLPEESRGKIQLAGVLNDKIKALQRLSNNSVNIVIGSAYSFTNRTMSCEKFRNSAITLQKGMSLNFSDFLKKLVEFDYDDELEVNNCGEFSRRGGIIDIFSPEYDYPARIEFWGDEIESIRKFDVETQRSIAEVDEYRILAKSEYGNDDSGESFCSFDYLRNDVELIIYEPEKVEENFLLTDGNDQLDVFHKFQQEKSDKNEIALFFEHDNSQADGISPCFVPLSNFIDLQSSLGEKNNSIDFLRKIFFEKLEYYASIEYKIVILSNQKERIESIKKYSSLQAPELEKYLTFDTGQLASGIVFPHLKLIIISENEVLTANAFKKKNLVQAFKNEELSFVETRKKINSDNSSNNENFAITLFDEGDYVVHFNYGIGIFKGLRIARDKSNFVRELMEIEYQDGQKILIPASQSFQLSRYIGSPGTVKLSKLNSAKWNNDKISAAKAVKDYARQMLRLQAVRNVQQGIAFDINEVDLKMFLSEFPYTDTPDQINATMDIKNDMANNKPMDRLLCGDVGYGKTEVAMRAAFMAVNAGYQVAVLAPTTILVQQHYESFCERFARYPFIIENLSRFKTAKEQADIFDRWATGKIDIIIGTSALCANSIKFQKLGLLIIDEEQRFGVKQKEKLREMRTEIDVLAMSATPIPRTLYLSMAGARDLSTLVTPPKERMVVKTLISQEDRQLIFNAINYELGRKGQVFYLHNRVKTIEDCHSELAKLVPNCKFAVAHGQMAEKDLKKVMLDFQNGKIDCLIASTIIESGLDIPNANTIIIERADRFGLAELYQLRGRVGRWKHQAFAYLLLPHSSQMTSDGHKRIRAIRRCSNLGAGFQLALQDLEIRGSGNLLGAEQSGHLNTIGFDLYCQMLKMEIALLKKEEIKFLIDVDISIDFLVLGLSAPEGILSAGIPPDYIESDAMRIGVYRKLAALNSLNQVSDYRNELIDRFGKLPDCVEYMLKYTIIRISAAEKNFRKLSVCDNVVYLMKGSSSYRDKYGKLPRLGEKNPPQLKLQQLIQILRNINE